MPTNKNEDERDESLLGDILEFKEGEELTINEDGTVSLAKAATPVEPVEDDDKPGEEEVGELDTGEEPVEDDDKPPDEEKSLKFKTHEDAEKAYGKLHGEFTKVTQRMAVLEKAYLEGGKGKEEPPGPDETPDPISDIVKKHNKAARERITALDPESSEYDAKVTDIWTETQAKVAEEVTEFKISQRTETDSARDSKINFVNEKLAEAGLTEAHQDFFWKYIAPQIPYNEDINKEIESGLQVFFSVGPKMKRKQDLSVMSKGGHVPRVKMKPAEETDEEPDTLIGGIEQVVEERRVKDVR